MFGTNAQSSCMEGLVPACTCLSRVGMQPRTVYIQNINSDSRLCIAAGRWGPRPLDLDIIFYGSHNLQHERLVIPHERWRQRPFVLAPLVDLANHASGDLRHVMPQNVGAPAPSDTIQAGSAMAEGIRERPAGSGGFNDVEQPQSGGSQGTTASSVTSPMQDACLAWAEAGGDSQVGKEGLQRVMPVRGRHWVWGQKTLVMGILNVTPDSFSDGGDHLAVNAAVSSAERMVEEGVDVLDVGGQSTRPGAAFLTAEEEMARVIGVIRCVRAFI